MEVPTAVVIARPEYLAAIRERLGGISSVAVVSDTHSLDVQASILARPPEILVIHPAFAASSRGATLVAMLKSKPRTTGTAVRVLIEDENKAPLLLSQTMLPAEDALLETSRPLDRAGTRQAKRYPMNRRAMVVNGEPCHLVDLSVTGAQVQVPMRLRPSQVVRFVLPAQPADIRCQGTVAWSIAVPSGGTVQYRVGMEFVNPDSTRLAAFCTRFGDTPDPNSRVT
ncbi:MAG: hypothetical protein A3J29_12355 [Acidobacteria bacterium RIFCSPLOWO2_12_FULL_67_14b]|nr:MAG: hypothetical protein A3J29_12355 [Acidobacteria bacterium RIFCSPLOWO2_12_FULL_67_14b]